MFRKAAAQLIRTQLRSKATLPFLQYDYAALEPHINAEIMELHHGKHHQAYVNNYNDFSEKVQEAEVALERAENAKQTEQISADIARMSQIADFNRGGHINHCIFWEIMSPNGGGECPESDLKTQIIKDFGSLENMQTALSTASAGVQGSGWGWLGYDTKEKCLKVATMANQDILEEKTGLQPLIGIDVWEHAYYLQYKNVRPDYVKNFWNVINWEDVISKFNAYK